MSGPTTGPRWQPSSAHDGEAAQSGRDGLGLPGRQRLWGASPKGPRRRATTRARAPQRGSSWARAWWASAPTPGQSSLVTWSRPRCSTACSSNWPTPSPVSPSAGLPPLPRRPR